LSDSLSTGCSSPLEYFSAELVARFRDMHAFSLELTDAQLAILSTLERKGREGR